MDQSKPRTRGTWTLWAVIAVCAAPLVLSYITYYLIKPESRNNYGALIDPRQYPIPPLQGRSLDGKPLELDAYKGKWVMLQVDSADCQQACKKKLYDMRQLRLTQGREMERVERVWLITDGAPLETMLMREYDGTHMLRADPARIASWLPVEQGTSAKDHIYMIDPLGNLMMRFPKDADPNRIKRDLGRLLKASKIG
ncbi:cytochrome C oxidase subunit I [Lacisediminimonas sp.]|uniref:SCO family protein n=1 Tax=Lacisediminimonas sp. TaxID=3060582 RepID=UPI00271CB014|nr:cytochrome C oxidase subunit I [Lacisediminimonas sp.]MDO8298628.1 cytochrome C oxidase subunit I [Lacisediminimonas sp.]MDO9216415.1 cytochrome C oxidase subunit I [Lacisediminimonas sp.]